MCIFLSLKSPSSMYYIDKQSLKMCKVLSFLCPVQTKIKARLRGLTILSIYM